MGSRVLSALALCVWSSGCLVDRELYEERRDALSGADDADGDGFLASVDCDDDDDDVNPGATEIYYNGVDEDCDTALTPDGDQDADGAPLADDCDDRDPQRSPTFDEAPYDGADNDCDDGTPDDDLDEDGFLLAQDCDDGDPAVNPGADEIVYDGADNDCAAGTPDDDLDGDGAVLLDDCDDADASQSETDEYHLDLDADGYGDPLVDSTGCDGDPIPDGLVLDGQDCDDLNAYLNPKTKWYEDADGDGYGAGPAIVACDPGMGFALVASDCADGDGTVFPGALDAQCGDGIPAPCALDTVCHADVPLPSPVFALDAPGGPSRAAFLTERGLVSVAGGGDANADGFPDVAIGDEIGRSVEFFDGTDLGDPPVDSGAWATLSGSPSEDTSLAFAGDVDGDGFDDLLIGAPGALPDAVAGIGIGRLYVAFGPSASDYFDIGALPVAITIPFATDPGLGATVGAAGDVDADGFDDVLVGSTNGKSWLIMGSPARLEAGPMGGVRELVFVDGLTGPASALGHVDIDADGLDDVVVGLSQRGLVGGPPGAVALYGGDVLAGLATGDLVDPDTTPRLLFTGSLENELAGASFASADVTDDGFEDLIVGAPGYGKDAGGRVYVFTGSMNVKTDIDFALEGSFAKIEGFSGAELGHGVAVLVGTSAGDGTEIAIGGADLVSLVPGPITSGTHDLEELEVLRAEQVGIGADLSAAGDVDRDGHGDLLVGREDAIADITAGAWLLFGRE